MGDVREEGVVFSCEGSRLIGVLHRGHDKARLGVLIIVGGPQYRVGSHRQFTLLARCLAADGFAVLRFDVRGSGDSEGLRAGFEHIDADVQAALDAFHEQVPGLERVVAWGLCDAASALLLGGGAHARLHAMVLLNPWVTEDGPSDEVVVRHYYARRVLSREFWRKLLGGGVSVSRAAREFLGALARMRRRAPSRGDDADGAPLSVRMARGLADYPGAVLIITSGNDLTAAQYLRDSRVLPEWRAAIARPQVAHEHVAEANHTFASADWRAAVEDLTLSFLHGIDKPHPPR